MMRYMGLGDDSVIIIHMGVSDYVFNYVCALRLRAYDSLRVSMAISRVR